MVVIELIDLYNRPKQRNIHCWIQLMEDAATLYVLRTYNKNSQIIFKVNLDVTKCLDTELKDITLCSPGFG